MKRPNRLEYIENCHLNKMKYITALEKYCKYIDKRNDELSIMSGKLLSCYELDFFDQLKYDGHFKILHKLEYYQDVRTGGHVISICFQMSKDNINKIQDDLKMWFIELNPQDEEFVEGYFKLKEHERP